MFSHMVVGSNDLEKSERFYDALFDVIGGTKKNVDPNGTILYSKGDSFFAVKKPLDGKKATPGNGSTIGFLLPSGEAIDKWHAAGVKNGGEAIESPPGIRERSGLKRYLAYLRDPDGNKLCAFHAIK